ncbi:MAG: MATE family efflux transporter [Leptospirales bacterium]|nr:MATE family efflux transporter [Leptospirales bacterium]
MPLFKSFRNASPGGIRELLAIAAPMMISTACDGLMVFTDRFFMAKIAPEQMNAVMAGGITMQTMCFFFIGLTSYSTALVAQYFGKGEKHKSTVAAFQAILVTLSAWPIIIALKPLAIAMFDIAGISPVQAMYQTEYLNVLVMGCVFGMMRYTMGCYFSGIGRTGIVMVATIAALLINIFLDYTLIFGNFGFDPMGISGAAFATISANACALLILFAAYFGKNNRKTFSVLSSFRFDKIIMKKLIRFGYPAGIEFFFNFVIFTILTGIFHSCGNVAATAATIMFSWDLVTFIPLLGIEISVTSLVGRYLGAKRPDIAYKSAISAIKTGILFSSAILVIFVFAPWPLVRVFAPDVFNPVFEQAAPIAVNMIRIASLYVLASAVIVAFIGTLRGAGDTFFSMIVSVMMNLLLLPVVYLSLKVFNLPLEAAWSFLVVCFLIFCAVLAFRFKSGKWKNIAAV